MKFNLNKSFNLTLISSIVSFVNNNGSSIWHQHETTEQLERLESNKFYGNYGVYVAFFLLILIILLIGVAGNLAVIISILKSCAVSYG